MKALLQKGIQVFRVHKKGMCMLCGVLVLFLFTFFLGRTAARGLTRSYLSTSSRLVYLFDLTASDMARIHRLLAHPDPLIRSAGYYGLLESGTAESDYLLGRYEKEQEQSVRMVILYVLYRTGDTAAVMQLRRTAADDLRSYIDNVLLDSPESERPECNGRIRL